jgi:hypothetical protein
MKNLLKLIAAAAVAFSVTSLQAAEGKDVKLSGEGKCAKCALKTADKCQNVVEVKDGDKTKTYYLVGDVSKAFHKNLCSGTMKVKLEGNCVEKDGKLEVTVAKIEEAK